MEVLNTTGPWNLFAKELFYYSLDNCSKKRIRVVSEGFRFKTGFQESNRMLINWTIAGHRITAKWDDHDFRLLWKRKRFTSRLEEVHNRAFWAIFGCERNFWSLILKYVSTSSNHSPSCSICEIFQNGVLHADG